MTDKKTERAPYVAIIRMVGSEYPIFANAVEGDLYTDKFIKVTTTTKEGKKRLIHVRTEKIDEYEDTTL